MNKKRNQHSTSDVRSKIALITNHGYAGVEIPVGGAPDTGGQNFYVNSLAEALDEVGFDVTIFARGGFEFFGKNEMREGIEQLTDNVRYVYIPGGGDTFLRKEDIAIALDEETTWLENFVAQEAKKAGVKPWDYYKLVNTHYWDAAVMGVKLVERWQNQGAQEFIQSVADGKLAPKFEEVVGEEIHRQGLAREINLHLGEMARATYPNETNAAIVENLTGWVPDTEDSSFDPGPVKREFAKDIELGRTLADALKLEGENLNSTLKKIDTHVWTPHSLGIIKERNFWHKPEDQVRKLKFRERDSHEQVLCARTPLFCSTSPELWRSLVSYHQVSPKRIFDFPPCVDGTIFKPRTDDELEPAYTYLAEQAGMEVGRLKNSKIIFETSRMDRTKRKDVLLRSFAKVASQMDDVYLFIGGGPSSSPVFKELEEVHASLPQLQGRAFLLGFVPEDVLEPIFSVPDLFVSASEMEGFGMSVSQAAGAGVAVISSDLIPFATQYAGDAAVVVKAGDVDGFAQAMTRLLENENERRERAQALLKIAKNLDWLATSRRFAKWFEDNR